MEILLKELGRKAGIVGGAILVLFALSFAVDSVTVLTSTINTSDAVFERTVVGYQVLGEGKDAIVAYDYAGEALPAFLDEKELIEKRTETSYTKEVGVNDQGETIYQLIAYPEKTFVEQDGAWYVRETARTTYETFAALTHRNPIAALFWEKAYADSISPFAGAGDGDVRNEYPVGDTWPNARDAVTGSAANPTPSTAIAGSDYNFGIEDEYYVRRIFLPFDTSAIPSGATISVGSLNTYVTARSSQEATVDYVTVVRSSQATHTTLTTTDFDALGTTEGIDAGEREDLDTITTSAYAVFTLNSTGLGWIAKSGEASTCSATAGVTCLALREGHDNTNTAPTVTGTAGDYVTISTSENTGTTQDPFLSVTYAAGGGVLTKPPNNLGLMGYWSFNEGTSTQATDFSGNVRHGTLSTAGSGLPLWSSGKRGAALEFDGTDEYVAVGNAGSGVQTVTFWMKADDTTSRKVIDLNGTAQVELDGSSQVTATSFTSPTIYIDGSSVSSVVDSEWHHVAITTGTGIAATAFDIGRVSAGYFDGRIDEVRVYSRALGASEVASLARSGATRVFASSKTLTQGTTLGAAGGLIGLWSFDGGDINWTSPTAGVAYDGSGNGNTGTLTSMERIGDPVIGRLGQALNFDGDAAAEYVHTGTNVSASGAMTVCAWAKADLFTSGSEDTIIARANAAGSRIQYSLHAGNESNTNTKTLRFFWTNDAGTTEEYTTSGSIITGVWYHLCGVRSTGGVGSMYRDGVNQSTSVTGDVTPTADATLGTAIGRAGDLTLSLYWDGLIDEVRVYNRELSAAEVKQLYNLGAVKVRP